MSERDAHSGTYVVQHSDETRDKLRALWASDLSTAMIGIELGWGPDGKNRVVGLAHRMGLPKKPSPIKRNTTPRPPKAAYRPAKTLPDIITPAAATKPASKPQKAQEGPPNPYKTCQWPTSSNRPWTFCGAATALGKPYCPKHVKLARGVTVRPMYFKP